MKYDYLLVGAGLFNAVFASLAKRKGKKCLVIEKKSEIGGQCFTRKENGIIVHQYGAHVFYTSDKEVWEYVNGFCDFIPFVNQPIAKYEGKIYNLPFNMNTFYELFGVSEPQEVKRIIESQANCIPLPPKNLEEHAISLVGYTVYYRLIKGYTEKQWGKKCSELPASVMKRIPVRYTFDNNYYSDKWQGIPSEGYTELIGRMLKGNEVKCGTKIFPTDFSRIADKTIYTGAIDEYFNYSEGMLEWRSLKFDEVWYETDNLQGNAVVNYTGKDVPYTRTIEHKHFNGANCPKTIVSYEYPVKWEEGLEKYYPIEDERNLEMLRRYQKRARNEKNVVFAGRLGSYKYTNMQDTVRNAMDLFKRLEYGNV